MAQLPSPAPLFGSSELHAWNADWNCGEFASIPWGTDRAPLLDGSGKFGSPCVCMQWANASSAELFDPPPPLVADPPGSRFWQAWTADWKFGLFWSLPLIRKCPFWGSGKSGTPCERTHWAKATAPLCEELDEPAAPEGDEVVRTWNHRIGAGAAAQAARMTTRPTRGAASRPVTRRFLLA